MAGPADISDIVNFDVQIATGDGLSIQSFGDPLFVSEFAANASFPDRVKAYVGTAADMRAALIADGFATTSAPVRQVAAAMVQKSPPRTIFIGRADPADITWEQTMTAIWDEATLQGFSLYAFACDTRDPADIEAIDDWVFVNQQFALFIGSTDSASVKSNTPGNVALNLIAKGNDRTALIWHDAAVASGYGPAILRSRTGPFALNVTSGTIKLRIDGGIEQTFTLLASAATLLGSNTAPFVFANVDQLLVTVDGGDLQTLTVLLVAATVLSGSAETYNFASSGLQLKVRADGGSELTATFNGTAGSFDIGAEPYAPVAATTTFEIDGGAPQVVDWTGVTTAAQAKVALDAQLTGVTTTIIAGPAVRITSNRLGTGSNVEITANAGNALAEFVTTVGANNGSGFAAFLDAATAAEVALVINALAGLSSADDGGNVRITSDTLGTGSRIQVTGGTANAVLGFNTNEFAGDGDFADASAVSAAEVQSWLVGNLYGVTVTIEAGAIRLTSKVLGTDSSIDVDAGNVATVLGFSLTAAVGGGDFANAATAQANEIATKISATLAGGTANSASSQVVITSSTSGPTSTVQITGGTLASRVFSALTAAGTGTDEDYIDCAYIGHCITFQLDRPNGQSIWDNVNLVGIAADRLTPAERSVLQNTLKVNTYETRAGRREMHRGVCCFGSNVNTNRFIDQRVSADWGKARLTEAFKSVLNLYAEAKAKIPLTDDGIEIFANEMRRVARTGETNGHWIFDGSTIDSIVDTGITVPTIAGQTQADLNNRRVVGFKMQFVFQDAIQSTDGSLKLSVVTSAA